MLEARADTAGRLNLAGVNTCCDTVRRVFQPLLRVPNGAHPSPHPPFREKEGAAGFNPPRVELGLDGFHLVHKGLLRWAGVDSTDSVQGGTWLEIVWDSTRLREHPDPFPPHVPLHSSLLMRTGCVVRHVLFLIFVLEPAQSRVSCPVNVRIKAWQSFSRRNRCRAA